MDVSFGVKLVRITNKPQFHSYNLVAGSHTVGHILVHISTIGHYRQTTDTNTAYPEAHATGSRAQVLLDIEGGQEISVLSGGRERVGGGDLA